jgi:hypothetical protein
MQYVLILLIHIINQMSRSYYHGHHGYGHHGHGHHGYGHHGHGHRPYASQYNSYINVNVINPPYVRPLLDPYTSSLPYGLQNINNPYASVLPAYNYLLTKGYDSCKRC